jgi:hypothetical protein
LDVDDDVEKTRVYTFEVERSMDCSSDVENVAAVLRRSKRVAVALADSEHSDDHDHSG